MNLADYTNRWSRTILPLKTPATIATFSSHIRKMNGYFGGVELQDLTESRVQEHVSELAKSLSPKGLKNYMGTMRLILGRAAREGLIQSVPEPVLPKLVKHPQPWLTAKQMGAVVDASEGQYKLLFYLLAETGMRIGEALGLQWQDIDLANQSLKIERSIFNGETQPPKSSNAIRHISTSKSFTVALENAKRNSSGGFVFTTSKDSPLAANAILVQKLHPSLRSFGISKRGFHAFRRGNATILANIGVPEKIAATRLGHGLSGITFGLYAQSITLADRPYVESIAKELETGGSLKA